MQRSRRNWNATSPRPHTSRKEKEGKQYENWKNRNSVFISNPYARHKNKWVKVGGRIWGRCIYFATSNSKPIHACLWKRKHIEVWYSHVYDIAYLFLINSNSVYAYQQYLFFLLLSISIDLVILPWYLESPTILIWISLIGCFTLKEILFRIQIFSRKKDNNH